MNCQSKLCEIFDKGITSNKILFVADLLGR